MSKSLDFIHSEIQIGMKILLLQARNPDDPAKFEERVSFAKKVDLPLDSFISHDLLIGPPKIEDLQDYQAVMIGGSGDYDVSKRNLPYFSENLTFLRSMVEVGIPTFASCFGFHLLTQALGGKIVNDAPNMEVGTYEITLTERGEQDELFKALPAKFYAQLGRKDRAAKLPSGVEHLASSRRCRYQAFRIVNKPIWATQFHPELDGTENQLRYKRYLSMYESYLNPEEKEAALKRFSESAHANQLLNHFLRLITKIA